MFVHIDKKFKIAVPCRCGSTSFHKFFGYTQRYKDKQFLDFQKKDKKIKIYVLRPPMERYHSANKMKYCEFNTWEWSAHFSPILAHHEDWTKTTDFYFIHFKNINSYLNGIHEHQGTLTRTDKVKIKPNDHVTQEAMNKELELYDYVINNKQELPLDLWKSLTEHK
jgi:hypothetical protein